MVKLGRCAAAATLVLLLSGCGDSEPTRAEPPAAPTTTAAASLDLRAICPQVEADLPDVDASGSAWRQFNATLAVVFEQADLEAQNALRLLAPGTKSMQRLAEKGGIPVGAEMDLSRSLQGFGARCQAAGSSAFS